MRCEFTDEEWTAIRPMLPNKPRGVPRVNDRRILNGIFWVLRSGMRALAGVHDAAVQMIGTSIIRLHEHGACITRNRRQSMGRSRGGLTSKIHAVVDAHGLPVRLALTAGEAHNDRLAGRPQSHLKSGAMLLADRGHEYGLDQNPSGREERMARYPATVQSQRTDLLQSVSLSCPQFGGAVLQKDQAVSPRGNAVR